MHFCRDLGSIRSANKKQIRVRMCQRNNSVQVNQTDSTQAHISPFFAERSNDLRSLLTVHFYFTVYHTAFILNKCSVVGGVFKMLKNVRIIHIATLTQTPTVPWHIKHFSPVTTLN